jgi:hypothetical protein
VSYFSGTNWLQTTTEPAEDIHAIFFTDQETGWIAGNAGTILMTVDGGIDWDLSTSGTSVDLLALHFLNPDTGWVVGDSGRILFTTTGGGELNLGDASMLPPASFGIYQNFPNPFNPITKINYYLPKQKDVTITIYDMLGRQVRTLINQTQYAGFHSVIWNTNNDYGKPVSAGIYLYQIQAGEYLQTKKMVLLK